MCVTVNRHVTENGHNECDFIVSRFLYIAEDKSSLYWHKDASNKFIVKRQPGPFTFSSTSTTSTTTESPMVKIVRYDPGNEEVRKNAKWLFYESNSRLTLGYSKQTCKWQQESWWSYHEVRDLVKTLPGMRTMAGWFFVCDSFIQFWSYSSLFIVKFDPFYPESKRKFTTPNSFGIEGLE